MGTPARLGKPASSGQTAAYGRITPQKSWNFGLEVRVLSGVLVNPYTNRHLQRIGHFTPGGWACRGLVWACRCADRGWAGARQTRPGIDCRLQGPMGRLRPRYCTSVERGERQWTAGGCVGDGEGLCGPAMNALQEAVWATTWSGNGPMAPTSSRKGGTGCWTRGWNLQRDRRSRRAGIGERLTRKSRVR